ncbi:MAG: hypothetical protein R2757_21760 [Draconibacterium sp.]
MNSKLFFLFLISLSACYTKAQDVVEIHSKSIRSFGVLPKNTANVNQENLQKAIDWAALSGAALYVEPTEKLMKFRWNYPEKERFFDWGQRSCPFAVRSILK